jgi:hypothetical protein
MGGVNIYKRGRIAVVGDDRHRLLAIDKLIGQRLMLADRLPRRTPPDAKALRLNL